MIEKQALKGFESHDYRPFVREKTEKLLLECLKKSKPKRILEIGTFLGYSALLMHENCPEAEIVSVEKDRQNFEDATENLKSTSIKLINDDAMNFLQNYRGEKFDFIFLDGPKGQYFKYFPLLKDILAEKGTLFSDDIFYYGLVEQQGKIDHKHRSIVNNLRRYIELLSNDSDFETTFFHIDDGVGVSIKKIASKI